MGHAWGDVVGFGSDRKNVLPVPPPQAAAGKRCRKRAGFSSFCCRTAHHGPHPHPHPHPQVSNPTQFDVMVAPNLYGNLVANVVAGLCGGEGIVPGGNIGNDYAVFEQVGGWVGLGFGV